MECPRVVPERLMKIVTWDDELSYKQRRCAIDAGDEVYNGTLKLTVT